MDVEVVAIGKLRPGRLGRQISLVVVGDAITMVATVVAGMILARLMAPADMGTYRQIAYLGQLAASLAEMGLGTSIYRFWNDLDESGRGVYSRMLLVSTLVLGSSASALLALLAGDLAVWYENPDLRLALLIAAPFPISAIPIQFLRPVLISQGASLKATAIEMVFALVSVGSLAVPVALGWPLHEALVVWVLACIARVLVVPFVLRAYLLRRDRWWDRHLAETVWGYLWPLQVSRLPGLLSSYLDQIVMSLYLSPRAFAIYSMGARELPLVGMVGSSLSSVLLPHLVQDVSSGRTDQICRRWRKAIVSTALLSYPVAAFAILNATPLMQFMFSASYRESAVPFRVFSVITFVRVVEYASIVKAFNRTPVILHATFFSTGVQIALGLILAWRYGVVGMAVAVVVGYVAGAAWLLRATARLLKRPFGAFFPYSLLILIAALAFLAARIGEALLAAKLPLEESMGMLSLGIGLLAHAAVSGTVYLGLIGLFAEAAKRSLLPGIARREVVELIE